MLEASPYRNLITLEASLFHCCINSGHHLHNKNKHRACCPRISTTDLSAFSCSSSQSILNEDVHFKRRLLFIIPAKSLRKPMLIEQETTNDMQDPRFYPGDTSYGRDGIVYGRMDTRNRSLTFNLYIHTSSFTLLDDYYTPVNMVLRGNAVQKRAIKLQREDYQIEWICPLVIERAAAEAMSDKRHESLPNHEDDINVYTLGRIGRHNVAITGLPDASSLAMFFAARHMRFAFTNIRVTLLVGIGGGVPGGENDPADELWDIVNAVRCRHQTLPVAESPAFVGYLTKAIEARPRMQAHYPGADQDRMFEHTYDHEPNSPTCKDCDVEKLVHRKARQKPEPRVHHGLIASANNVIQARLTQLTWKKADAKAKANA
ncbi:hypothetical protein BDV97DRAFT_388361 [Delphinella strobiligena]|nr:hypothetical protein BDV97DRAFT_388361 [Delphinella strobiligena]